MKDIQLCGIGNGLVDLQYEISFEELTELNFNKGNMCLVDGDIQKKLLEKLYGKPHNICSGGSAANTIIAFSQFGGKCAYKTLLGNDKYGHFYANEFKELGIELRAPLIDNKPTGTCVVLITPDSERTMITSLGATALFGVNNIDEDLIRRAEWLYLEGYKLTADSSVEATYHAIKLAKKHNTKIAFTMSDVFVINSFNEQTKQVVEQSDLIFCNESEAKCLTNQEDFESAFIELLKICTNVALTRGEFGSIIQWDGQRYEIPAYSTVAIDSTGAGDMYAGGFLYGILNQNSPENAGRLASLSASKVVAQLGARLKDNHKLIRDIIYL